MLKQIFILLLLFIITAFSITAGEEYYCRDSESWKEWDTLVKKYPDDIDIQTLHALRLGLCVKVERGDITVQEATKIFESARIAILRKKAISHVPKEKNL